MQNSAGTVSAISTAPTTPPTEVGRAPMSFPRTRESRRPRRSGTATLSAPTTGPDLRRRILTPGYPRSRLSCTHNFLVSVRRLRLCLKPRGPGSNRSSQRNAGCVNSIPAFAGLSFAKSYAGRPSMTVDGGVRVPRDRRLETAKSRYLSIAKFRICASFVVLRVLKATVRPWGGALQRRQRQKFGESEKWIWIDRNPLKWLKTAKTFFGTTLLWKSLALEALFIWKVSTKALVQKRHRCRHNWSPQWSQGVKQTNPHYVSIA
jgi:hypothetical protein